MNKNYDEGYEAGINAGYDDANFANAYGGKVDAQHTFTARKGDQAWAAQHADYYSGFMTGHPEGVERFENDQWPDGSPRDED